MKKNYFGTDGIRGTVGVHPITPDFVLKLGWAAGQVFAREHNNHDVLIGKDTRISGYMFESALEAGLSAAGVNTKLLGPMPTPAVSYLTRTFRAQAGIVISASHNPYYDNGIKFFGPDGLKLPDELELQIEAQLAEPMTTVSSDRIGKAARIRDAEGRYIEFCKSTIPARLDFNGLKIVVDCAHGSTYHIAPCVFTEIGACVTAIGVEPDGLNINQDVGATSPKTLSHAVLEQGADLGIALDGDGDRLIMVDHRGEIVDGDQILFILASARTQLGQLQGPVIGTLMSNLGLEHALEGLGIAFKRAAVGDRYVMEMMRQHDSTLGGEASGHIICRDKLWTGDGIVAALQVLEVMHQSGKSLHDLKQAMPVYPQTLINVKIRERVRLDDYERIIQTRDQIQSELCGRGRVLLRPSGTEPLIRVMVEGPDTQQVLSLAERLAETVRDELGV
ncbi:MAG: phosphoglucosamine mutase [Methylococcaceae bacterium]